MKLLRESKRAWLLSYFIVTVIAMVQRFFFWSSTIGKVSFALVTEMQILMLAFFVLIILFKWKHWCRLIITAFYVAESTYLGVNHAMYKWYFIVLISIPIILYMLWNVGGIVNCLTADKYEIMLNEAVSISKGSYEEYRDGVEQYNKRNELGFWTKIRTKQEPEWNKYGFNSSGLEMFKFENAFLGVRTDEWDEKLLMINKISSNLENKHSALRNNQSLHEEKNLISKMREKTESFGGNTETFDKQRDSINSEIGRSKKCEKKIS